jgi:hypothetical protein
MSTAADGHRRGFGDVEAVWIIGAVFDISGEPSDVDSALRDLHRANIDLIAMMPGSYRPAPGLRERWSHSPSWRTPLAVAVSLGTQTTEAGRLEQLDGALRSNRFFEWLKKRVGDAQNPR